NDRSIATITDTNVAQARSAVTLTRMRWAIQPGRCRAGSISLARVSASFIVALRGFGEGGNLALDPLAGLVAGAFEVVVGLEVHPEIGGGPEEAGEPQRRVGRDGALAEDDLVD